MKAWMAAAVLAAAWTLPADAAELVSNGDFAAGLSGWTPYLTVNGVANSTATTFDVTGSGVQTAARLEVGQILFEDPDYPGSTEKARGGGLVQLVDVAAGGRYRFSADFAAQVAIFNYSGGIFALLLDGVEVASFNTGEVDGVVRGSLGWEGVLAAGAHSVAIQATRPFIRPGGTYQYFTNVSLADAAAPVPEPATWLMLVTGFAVTGVALRRRATPSAAR